MSYRPKPKDRASKQPSLYISIVHNEFLPRLCEESGLEGMKYKGGPLVKCTHPKCEWRGVLPFVSYPDELDYPSEVECKECYTLHNIDHILNPEVVVL